MGGILLKVKIAFRNEIHGNQHSQHLKKNKK